MEPVSRPSVVTGKEAMHWTKRPAWIALHFREPALRIFGDLRTAVANSAIAIGCYCLLFGCWILIPAFGIELYGGLYIAVASSLMACFTAIINAFLYYACMKQKNDTYLEQVLCTTMTLYKIDMPFSVIAYFVSGVISRDFLPFWILLRMAMCILHMCLVYCLLVELRQNTDTFPSPVLQPNAHHLGVTVSEKFPTKDDAESGVLAPP